MQVESRETNVVTNIRNSLTLFRAAKDPCSPNPCHHGGHCLSHGEVDYECECGRGYTGLKCESKFTYLTQCLRLLHTVWNGKKKKWLFTFSRAWHNEKKNYVYEQNKKLEILQFPCPIYSVVAFDLLIPAACKMLSPKNLAMAFHSMW